MCQYVLVADIYTTVVWVPILLAIDTKKKPKKQRSVFRRQPCRAIRGCGTRSFDPPPPPQTTKNTQITKARRNAVRLRSEVPFVFLFFFGIHRFLSSSTLHVPATYYIHIYEYGNAMGDFDCIHVRSAVRRSSGHAVLILMLIPVSGWCPHLPPPHILGKCEVYNKERDVSRDERRRMCHGED